VTTTPFAWRDYLTNKENIVGTKQAGTIYIFYRTRFVAINYEETDVYFNITCILCLSNAIIVMRRAMLTCVCTGLKGCQVYNIIGTHL